MDAIDIRPVTPADREWITTLLMQHWGSSRIVTRGRIHQADQLPGFIARIENRRSGLVTFRFDDSAESEIISLNSLVENQGIGRRLIDAVVAHARENHCRRIWLITTNDNTPAIRFHQKQGFVLIALHRNALEVSRQLKPEIPLLGLDGIPLRDELEFELPLG